MHTKTVNAYTVYVFGREQEERSDLEDLGVDARLILKYALGEL
jgi:hypothetical protein